MNKKQFLEKYGRKNLAILCKTRELVKEFLKLCEDFDIKWVEGHNATSFVDLWSVYTDKTCFCLNEGRFLTYGSKDWFEDDYAIIPFEPKQKKEERAKEEVKKPLLTKEEKGLLKHIEFKTLEKMRKNLCFEQINADRLVSRDFFKYEFAGLELYKKYTREELRV